MSKMRNPINPCLHITFVFMNHPPVLCGHPMVPFDCAAKNHGADFVSDLVREASACRNEALNAGFTRLHEPSMPRASFQSDSASSTGEQGLRAFIHGSFRVGPYISFLMETPPIKPFWSKLKPTTVTGCAGFPPWPRHRLITITSASTPLDLCSHEIC